MPIRDWTPNAEIMLQYALRGYVGETLYTISDNGDPPAYTSVVGPPSWQEPFADLYAVLASRTLGLGSGTASDALAAQAAAAGLLGDWAIRLNPDTDLIEVTCTNEAFSIEVTTLRAWGFPAGTINSTVQGGLNVATATLDWTRGPRLHTELTLNITGVDSEENVLFRLPYGRYQGIPELLLDFTDVSDDELNSYDPCSRPTDNISYLGQVGFEDDEGIWFYLDDDGYVCCVLKDGWTIDLATAFGELLGFTGSETGVTISTGGLPTATEYNLWTATNKPRYVFRLQDCLQSLEPFVQSETISAMASDGSIEKHHLMTLWGWNVAFTLQGLSRSDTPDGGKETFLAALNEIFETAFEGTLVTIYPNYRERRLSGRRRCSYTRQKNWDPEYSAWSTPETKGYVGALRCSLGMEYARQDFVLQDNRIRAFYAPIQWALTEYVYR